MSTELAELRDPLRAPAESEWPPDLQLLLGDDAAGILAAVAGAAGGELLSWAPRQVTHQPGTSTVVQYRADLAWPDGTTTVDTIVATTGDRIPDGAAVFQDGATRVGAWRWPIDPALPGLDVALDRHRVGGLLDQLGVGGDAPQLRVAAYRPGRRAVIEARGRRGRLFLKVVRPHKVEALHDVHRALSGGLPVPDSLGWTDDGIVVLEGLPGRTLREVLRSGDDAPAPTAVDALLDRLPAEFVDGPRRRDLVDGAGHHGAVVAATLPAVAPQVEALVEALRSAPTVDHELVPVHGDLYEAQILVARGRITGLLDVDTAGSGHRVDDLANLVAHLSVLGLVSDRPRAIKRYGAAVLAHAESQFDRADLRTRIAAAVVGLATGPFRVLEANWPMQTVRRLDLAQEWLDSVT